MDIINSLFESFAGVFVFMNVLDIWKNKFVSGQTLFACSFFSAWGIWNLLYYPSLGQFWSFAGGIFVTIANLALIFVVWKFRHKK